MSPLLATLAKFAAEVLSRLFFRRRRRRVRPPHTHCPKCGVMVHDVAACVGCPPDAETVEPRLLESGKH